MSTSADVNECDDGTNDCDLNADCLDLDGSFTCTCRTGYYSEEGGNARNGTCLGKCYSNYAKLIVYLWVSRYIRFLTLLQIL